MNKMTQIYESVDSSAMTSAAVLKNETTNKFHVIFRDVEAEQIIGVTIYDDVRPAIARAQLLCGDE